MMKVRPVAIALGCASLFTTAGPAWGQDYPSKIVRIYTSAPASTNDIVARMIAQGLTASLKQPAIVENRGTLAGELVARAEPDGHTILFYGGSVYLLPMMRPAPYDPMKDLAPVTAAVSQVTLLVVHPSLPVKSVKELIALAKARPGELNYGAGTLGASPHLATEQFKLMTGVDIVRVAYKGTGPSVIGLYSGEVVVMFVGMGSVESHLKSGRLRALAVTTPKRTPLAPGLPTVGETVPGYEFVSEIGMYAPGRTPAAIINLLQREILRILQAPEIKERLFKNGIDVIGNTPQEFGAMIKADVELKRKLLKQIGMLRQ
jgi:tripartite-type tricarboxylate transporter receptor subunit TctC